MMERMQQQCYGQKNTRENSVVRQMGDNISYLPLLVRCIFFFIRLRAVVSDICLHYNEYKLYQY